MLGKQRKNIYHLLHSALQKALLGDQLETQHDLRNKFIDNLFHGFNARSSFCKILTAPPNQHVAPSFALSRAIETSSSQACRHSHSKRTRCQLLLQIAMLVCVCVVFCMRALLLYRGRRRVEKKGSCSSQVNTSQQTLDVHCWEM